MQVFALHPLYLCLRATAHHLPTNIDKRIQEAQAQLEALPAVDYVETMRLKLEIARDIFEHTSSEDLHVRVLCDPVFSFPPLSLVCMPTLNLQCVWSKDGE
jgi:4-alpha-glucanotransferase